MCVQMHSSYNGAGTYFDGMASKLILTFDHPSPKIR